LAQLRQENATVVLSAYRARPLEAVNGGKTLVTAHDCVRIALENSLELQAAAWDERVKNQAAAGQLVRMLPKVEGLLVESQRDRPLFSRSDVLDQEGAYEAVGPGPGTGVTTFSTGREHTNRNYQVQATWSPLDAAMARYLGDVRGNEAVQARYQRVRVAQQLTGTVVGAFHRLLALTQAAQKAAALESHRRNITNDLKALVQERLVESKELLDAQAQWSHAKGQLSEILVNIGKQRELLAAAMNVCPDSPFQLAGGLLPLPSFCLDSCKLESAALVNRPEAYQADLTHLSSISDQRRLAVKFFPRVEGFLGYFRDENKYVMNRNWIDGGIKVTWDLMEFTANILEHRSARDRVMKTDRDRAAVSMGILTQVKLKTLEAMNAHEKYRKTEELLSQAREALRIATEVERAKESGSNRKLMLIAREKAACNVLQVEVERLLALGDLHGALAELDTAVGVNYPVSAAHPQPGMADRLGRLAGAPLSALKGAGGFVGALWR
jgi:outer membrane protein TolC